MGAGGGSMVVPGVRTRFLATGWSSRLAVGSIDAGEVKGEVGVQRGRCS